MGDRTPAGDNGDEHILDGSWQKSSYSMSNGHCLETAHLGGGYIGVRDSKAVEGPTLRFEPSAWAAFLARLRSSSPFKGKST